ncbi:hypothetical protein BLNAU_21831 [Blattamonas nauphoetae]|uniref:BAR domain-containing protein n=1 Tax=Blattamonas nauphoetae TaxID=2049346 RepID=A0ABQ9WUT4_9EUKA|nr:hypothetical protein BLNAU_21831 [Blattamonas nauphoetae]
MGSDHSSFKLSMTFFKKLKETASTVKHSVQVAVTKTEQFQETEEFKKKEEDNIDMLKRYEELCDLATKMVDSMTASAQAQTAYFNKYLEYAEKDPSIPRDVVKTMDAMKSYVQYQTELVHTISKVAIQPDADFFKSQLKKAEAMRTQLTDVRLARDAAGTERVKGSEEFKNEKAAEKFRKLDEQYKVERRNLMELMEYCEVKRNHDIVEHSAHLFEATFTYHATYYSDMATIQKQVRDALEGLKRLPPPPVPSVAEGLSPSGEGAKEAAHQVEPVAVQRDEKPATPTAMGVAPSPPEGQPDPQGDPSDESGNRRESTDETEVADSV